MASTLSVIVDQRCCDDSAFLTRRVRDVVLDTCLEVVHVAWWGVPPPLDGDSGIDGGGRSDAARSTTKLRIGLQIIANNEGAHTVVPPTDVASLGTIRDLFGSGYQQQLHPTRSSAEWVAPLVTHTQVVSIAGALHNAAAFASSSSASSFITEGSHVHAPSQQHRASDVLYNATHVVLVTTLFHTQTFSARAAAVLPPLVSFPHPVAVTIVHIDADAKTSSHLNVAPSISLVRHPMGHREALATAVLPPLLRWAASCLLPVDVAVSLCVGQRAVACRASCALISTLPRWSLPDYAFHPSTVSHGWSLVDSAYNHCRREMQLQTLTVERCVSRKHVDEAYLYGEGWHVVPALADAESHTWWKALYEAATTTTTASLSDAPGGGGCGGQPATANVLFLSSSNHFFAPQSSIGLQLHCFVGIFAPDGASMLLRALAPNECRRVIPPEPQLSMRASPSMVDELRGVLFADQLGGDNNSRGHLGFFGRRSPYGRGGVTVAVGLLYQAEASAAHHGQQRRLQVVAQYHSNGQRGAAARGGRSGGRGSSLLHRAALH